MKLPKKWLCEYVDFNVTNEEFIEKMMWRGFELAAVEKELPGVEGVVVGRVDSIVRHENSDHLNICKVDVGHDEALTIVTGAQNVSAGDYVPVALVGAALSGHVMEPVNMRGVMSYGMLCSGKELGLTDADYPGSDVNGILILCQPCSVGQSIEAAVGLDDVVFDFDLTPNRPDCAGIIGLCREAAAALGQKFSEPSIKSVKGAGREEDYASVTILNPTLCPRYTARVVKDIHIAPSPMWMQRKIRSMGMRPINNIVDITNYVLLEYGHPMHAFDLSCVTGGHIVVRNAIQNEVVTTLDGKQRPVTPDMLLIADSERGVGIAGVMGGLNSEITQQTKAVLFESAVFVGSNIRSTTRKLHHVTDAAARFVKGVEPVNALLALNRAVELVEELGAGTVVGDTIDVCSADLRQREVKIDCGHVNALLNLDLAPAKMAEMLGSIGIHALPLGNSLHVHIPHFRTDIESGVEADWDIAEEVARVYGYYNIAPTLMNGKTFRGCVSAPFRLEDLIKDTLAAHGGYEMYNYNFTGPAELEMLLLSDDDEKRQTVRILNPFGEDQSLMRTTLYSGMIDTAVRNINRRSGHGRFFEVGNVHFDNNPTLPEERKMVGLLFYGENESFYTLKGVVEELLDRCGVKNVTYARSDSPYFQPGRAAKLLCADGTYLGELGDLHPDVTGAAGLDQKLYAAELRFDVLLKYGQDLRRYAPLPRYPVVERDVAVVTDAEAEAESLAAIIRNTQCGAIIESVRLFDLYQGVGILPGKKSLAYSFTLRAEDHTLSDEEIKAAMDIIIAALENAGASLRG